MRAVLLTWLAFLAFGFYFALVTPLGEGFDEPWHFGYVQYVAQTGHIPLGRSTRLSEELVTFLEKHPVSWWLNGAFPSLLAHEEYWAQERPVEDAILKNLRFSGKYHESSVEVAEQYERHQPPLYYVFAARVFVLASRFLPLVDTFLALRLFSVLLASTMVPAAFTLARIVLKDPAWTNGVGALVVLFPGLYPGVVRVANDALAVPLACWTFVMLSLFVEHRKLTYLYGLCALLAAGLWTKAFFLPILAAVLLVLTLFAHARAVVVAAGAALAGAPWYVYNLVHSGAFTGLPETVSSQSSIASSFGALRHLDWVNLINVAATSHIWIGNWSLLAIRSWMHKLILIVFLLGVLGILAHPRKAMNRTAIVLSIVYAVFVFGLVYYATQVFQYGGISVSQGWYLTSVIPIEAILFAVGVRFWVGNSRTCALAILPGFLLALLLYTSIFVAMPYYSGITAHKPDGHLATYYFKASDLALMPERLLRFHDWIPRATPWVLLSLGAGFGFWSIGSLVFRRPSIHVCN